MCTVCRTIKDKKDLLRIACDKENSVTVDETGKSQGRGAYICYNLDCLDKAIKSKKLDRAFETNINEEIYNSMRGVIIDKEN
ncbi:MAG: YlxR family protein [Oscillospiraceae bacterium]|nr:YlxR family protein [Oscillospiraceae bacterium]